MSLGQQALDAYNNTQGQGQGQGQVQVGGINSDVLSQLSFDPFSSGFVDPNVMGQLVGQLGGAAGACSVM